MTTIKTSLEEDEGKDDNDDKENDHHDGLSWYEQLRLSKISWNQEQLKMLGLNNKVFSSAAQPSAVVKAAPVPLSLAPRCCVRI